MNQKHYALLETLCEKSLQKPLSSCLPEAVSANEAMALLWPVNDLFRPRIHQIQTIKYRKQYETAADKAIEQFVLNDSNFADAPLVVGRVLLERHVQAILLCVANSMHNDSPLMYMPSGMSSDVRTKFVIVYLCYAMKLPYAVHDESQLDIDLPFASVSSMQH